MQVYINCNFTSEVTDIGSSVLLTEKDSNCWHFVAASTEIQHSLLDYAMWLTWISICELEGISNLAKFLGKNLLPQN